MNAFHFNAAPDDVFALPQLGGRHCDGPNRFFAPMMFEQTLVPTRTLRDISARTRSLPAAERVFQQMSSARRDRSFGCVCVRCSNARDQMVRNPRPLPPDAPPPRLRFPTIPEDTTLMTIYGAPVERDLPVLRHSRSSRGSPAIDDTDRLSIASGGDMTHVSLSPRAESVQSTERY